MIEKLIRPHIARLTPYSTARDEFTGSAQVYLDANENPFASDVNRYPDPHQRKVKACLSKLWDVPTSRLFVGNGSDEAIDLLVRALAAPGDFVVIMPPTYGMYKVAASTNDVRVCEVPLTDEFLPDIPSVESANKGKILFVCSPNNPTGNQLSLDVVRELLDVFPGVVVVDEAYVDFAAGDSVVRLLDEYDRVVVLRTLSKAWGLAGARLGVAIGDERIIAALSKIKAPYNVNCLTQAYVLESLSEPTRVKQQVTEIVHERKRLAKALATIPSVQRIYPSDANFLLVRFDRAAELFEYLKMNGVIVRDRSKEPGCCGCLRITVGTPSENTSLLNTLGRFL
jgi:histidinol-phosphate aminotransferase